MKSPSPRFCSDKREISRELAFKSFPKRRQEFSWKLSYYFEMITITGNIRFRFVASAVFLAGIVAGVRISIILTWSVTRIHSLGALGHAMHVCIRAKKARIAFRGACSVDLLPLFLPLVPLSNARTGSGINEEPRGRKSSRLEGRRRDLLERWRNDCSRD